MIRLGKLRVKRLSRYRNRAAFNLTTAKLMRTVSAAAADKLAKLGL